MQPATGPHRPPDKRGGTTAPPRTHDTTSGAPGTVNGPALPQAAPSRAPVPGAPSTGGTPARRAYLEVGAHPGAVPDARRFVRHTLDMWRPRAVADDCELVASELVTNAVTASAGLPFAALVGLLIAADNHRLFVLVMDASTKPPARQPRDDGAPDGRGLQLVEALSDRWGWCAAPGQAGKITWAILRIDRQKEAP